MERYFVNDMEVHFVEIPGFNGKYMISVDEPHIVIEKSPIRILDEWYNGYGEISVLLNGKLYLIDELLELIN